ncbi:hypothetical protein A4X13_0g4456 [Tilletia indica]|uniref:ATP-dependent DNA helicase n=1 Tax=Tilletia indica TaxID=43049 RepID=A0A8T8SY54_9BASI|nr:hypothetical protein A4X13_0g4456 [Tilletia indica]
MPRPTDAFHASTTLQLRNFLVAYCPGKRASRLKRLGLVRLLLDTFAQEEISALERAARLPLHQIKDLSRFLGPVHRQLVDRNGPFFATYLRSSERFHIPSLALIMESSNEALLQATDSQMELGDAHDSAGDDGEDSLQEPNAWPAAILQSQRDALVESFAHQTNITESAACAACGRRTFDRDLLFTTSHLQCRRYVASDIDLSILAVQDPHLLARPKHHFQYGDSTLDGLALHVDGIHVDGVDGTTVDICGECHTALTSNPPKLPPMALANDNVRGFLPAHLQDCTWLEERLCAKYLASAYIVRLYDLTAPGAPEERPRVMKGHACSFPLNTISTASKLPWAVDDHAALISCIVIGPRKPRTKDLRSVFKVRREKVRALFLYLREHCKGYPQFPVDEHALNCLPDDDVPELLMRHFTYEEHNEVPSLFAQETAGLDAHPAVLEDSDGCDEARTFLEHHGLLDINGISVPAHSRTGSALANATGTERPDLVIRHGSVFVEDYNNPDLFPGMFPTLFPWGTGGFESKRRTPLSFNRQAKYLLDILEPNFRRHWSFIFVVANIKQRRAIHLGSRLMCKSRDFDRFSTILRNLDPAVITRVAEHVSRGGNLQTLSGDEVKIFSILKKCELVSANVPGSKAVMNRARADIRAYVGQFGIFQLFLTLNPGPSHSPVFQIFFGDRTITLDTSNPVLPNAKERATRVADDPVAASDYFHFHVRSVFQFLLGWDFRKQRSTKEGGLFGRLAAFFSVKEHSMRGQLHCHTLIWLEGGLNPSVLRARMQSDEQFREQYLSFCDDILTHGYPAVEGQGQVEPEASIRKPRQERPPQPSHSEYLEKFNIDHHLLAHEVQRHRCTFTCFKGGRDSCRFLFPHDVVEKSSFDPATNSINLRVQHPYINWHNATLLVATRHNHDLKIVQSGKSGSAAASYITSYTTKSEETPANQISMINAVYDKMAVVGADTTDARALLSRCVMQFGRERQVHAQQASTYVRELGDTDSSHTTIPMLSGQLTATVHKLFGFPDEEESDSTPTAEHETCGTGANESSQGTPNDSADRNANLPAEDEELQQDPDSPGGGYMPLNHRGLAHQVDDYLHRGQTLDHLSYYDFVQYATLVKIPKRRNKNHHSLNETHLNFKTHLHRYNPERSLGIPRSLAASFPRRDGSIGHGDAYCSAMMAHFVPFSITQRLKDNTEAWEAAFQRTVFSKRSQAIMENWAALSECDDARDADQLRRRRQEAHATVKMNADIINIGEGGDSSTADVDMEALLANRADSSAETLQFVSALEGGGWFDLKRDALTTMNVLESSPFTWRARKDWAQEQAVLEAKAKADLATPTASHGVLSDQLQFDDVANEDTSTLDAPAALPDIVALPTQRLLWKDLPPDQLLKALIKERGLTPSQALAFSIAGRRFFEILHGVETRPLRLLMHGEAGTGKTVVVRLLRELLERFGRGHQIKFMAPTGKAASAIGGMTQHSAFSIDVHRRGLTTEELQTTQRENQGKRMHFLQTSFANTEWLFFDEVSMTSCEVFGEIDQALRIATQRLDEPFGGINVIFAGDLCQLPPVGAAPLYTRSSRSSQASDVRTKVELGRISWLFITDVVEFTEQMRMKDEDMAAALSRLRLRKSIDDDASLFNTNVLHNHSRRPSTKGRSDLVVLAATNKTIRALNERKAASQAGTDNTRLVISHAIDETTGPISAYTRAALLSYNGRGDTKVGIGRLPLFVGMPVVYRGPNKSVPLGVTNGAFGVIVAWHLEEDSHGLSIPVGAIVKFQTDATWRLSGLEPGCLPIYPTSSSFTFAVDGNADVVRRITRRQLPLQPGFAMTVHSAQGITCKSGVVVDLRRGGFPAYVAASRVTRRQDLFLISQVTTTQLNSPGLPMSLREELRRLQTLALATKQQHDLTSWTVGERTPPSHETPLQPTKRTRLT